MRESASFRDGCPIGHSDRVSFPPTGTLWEDDAAGPVGDHPFEWIDRVVQVRTDKRREPDETNRRANLRCLEEPTFCRR